MHPPPPPGVPWFKSHHPPQVVLFCLTGLWEGEDGDRWPNLLTNLLLEGNSLEWRSEVWVEEHGGVRILPPPSLSLPLSQPTSALPCLHLFLGWLFQKPLACQLVRLAQLLLCCRTWPWLGRDSVIYMCWLECVCTKFLCAWSGVVLGALAGGLH